MERRKEAPRAFLRSCIEPLLASNSSIPEKRDLVFKQELLSGLAFKADVIEDVFKEAGQMIDLTQSVSKDYSKR